MRRLLVRSSIQIDLYVSPYCDRCRAVLRELTAIRELAGRPLDIRERDVLRHLESAVAAGVRTTPALVMNGHLLASGSTSRARLQQILESALETEDGDGIHDRQGGD